MLHTKYQDLPDSMDTAEVRQHFDEVLAAAVTSKYDDHDVAETLWELADRQWHTYTLLDETTRESVENWIAAHWRTDSVDYLETLAAVTGRLGLRHTLDLFESALSTEALSPDVRREIERTVSELKPNVDDPYSGMRQ